MFPKFGRFGKHPGHKRGFWFGDPGTIRTCDLPLRRRLLYPTELRGPVRVLPQTPALSPLANALQPLLRYFQKSERTRSSIIERVARLFWLLTPPPDYRDGRALPLGSASVGAPHPISGKCRKASLPGKPCQSNEQHEPTDRTTGHNKSDQPLGIIRGTGEMLGR
jgi:hypothetical protein